MEPISLLLFWLLNVGLFALKMFVAGFALVAGAGLALKQFMSRV